MNPGARGKGLQTGGAVRGRPLSSGERTLGRSARLSSSLLARCQPGFGHGPGVPRGLVDTCTIVGGGKGDFGDQITSGRSE